MLEAPPPGGSPYLNVGHTALDRTGFVDWTRRWQLEPVFMLHDLIPLTHPEYCRSGEAVRHDRRVRTMIDAGRGIVVNSRSTHEALSHWAGANDLIVPPVTVAWLGTEAMPAPSIRRPLASPYFVILGTIEGRKNHLRLIEVWRELASWMGEDTPKLVIIGGRGWEAAQATALLDRCVALHEHVVELPGCDDAGLATWLRHACALLFPSFVEGFGMPLTEALALGTPVIVSDLPVFRELAGELPTYLNPTDGPGWRDAVIRFAARGSPVRALKVEQARAYAAPDWAAHFAIVDGWLDDLSRLPAPHRS